MIIKEIIFRSLTVILLLITVFLLPLFYPTGIAVYFRLLLLVFILFESLKLFKIIFVDRKADKIISNIATVLFSTFVLFIFLEAIFMFIPRSHSADFTLASRLWFAKYWKPINSLGFRDKEPDNHYPVILFVGNSFTAGHGLKSVDDRFSNIVGRELNKKGEKYSVINIGKPGADTLGEYNIMQQFFYMTRIKPKIIILQYLGTDIQYVAQDNGLKFKGYKLPAYVNEFTLLLGSGSYLFNYLYWLFPRQYYDAQYVSFLSGAYKNNIVLSKHKDEIRLFISYARKNSIRLIVLVFPFLTDLKKSDAMFVNDIVDFFKANGVDTINVSPFVKDIPVSERVINVNDGHPSKKVNDIVALEILKKL